MPRIRTQIRDESGKLTEAGMELGRQRMRRVMEGHGALQAHAAFLLVSFGMAAAHGYSDEALDSIMGDVRDLEGAAKALSSTVTRIVSDWRRQRDDPANR